MPRKFVRAATLDGFRAAVTPQVAPFFAWESSDAGPSLLFLGTGQKSTALSQDTWFQFVDGLDSVRYAIRISDIDHDSSDYGEARSQLLAVLSFEEAADFLEMCIEQALASLALTQLEQAKDSAKRRDA